MSFSIRALLYFALAGVLGACAGLPKAPHIPVVNSCVSETPSTSYDQGLVNVAMTGTASQSSTGFFKWSATPDLAIDGDKNGNYWQHSVSHTEQDVRAWWQVDLGKDQPIEKVVVWNRTDGGWGRRLNNFNVAVFDASQNTVFERNYCQNGKSFSPALVVDLPQATQGRYVKIMLNGKNYLQLAEVEVLARGTTLGANKPVVPTAAPSNDSTGASTTAAGSTQTAARASLPEWEIVGLWDYDGVDGQQVPNGFVLRNQPGSMGAFSWKRHLELVKHAQLPPRSRRLWPVQINRKQKRVCVDAPYPSYGGYVDLPGEAFDGLYAFASCKGGTQ